MLLTVVGDPVIITRCVSASPNVEAAADTVDIGMVMGFAPVVLAIVALFGGTYSGGILTGTIGPVDENEDDGTVVVVAIGSLAFSNTFAGCCGCWGGLVSDMVPSEGRPDAGV